MFGFALLAACNPAQLDWLKDRSSTPPVSSTMQALILPPAWAPPPLDTGLDTGAVEADDDEAGALVIAALAEVAALLEDAGALELELVEAEEDEDEDEDEVDEPELDFALLPQAVRVRPTTAARATTCTARTVRTGLVTT